MTETVPPKRLTLSQIVEMLLTRSTPERSSVSLSRNASGDTQIEVTVKTGDDGETVSVEDAERKAREVYDRLRETYPPDDSAHDAAEVALTRNAKGETQIAVTVKSAAGSQVSTLAAARDSASDVFRDLRARFPLSSGAVAAASDGD